MQGKNNDVVANILDWLGHEQQASVKHTACQHQHAPPKPPSQWLRR